MEVSEAFVNSRARKMVQRIDQENESSKRMEATRKVARMLDRDKQIHNIISTILIDVVLIESIYINQECVLDLLGKMDQNEKLRRNLKLLE